MITIEHNKVEVEFDTLTQAMDWAKELGEFVTIKINGIELVGKFGADSIVNGKCQMV